MVQPSGSDESFACAFSVNSRQEVYRRIRNLQLFQRWLGKIYSLLFSHLFLSINELLAS